MSRSVWKPPFCHPSVLRKWRVLSEKGGVQTRSMKIKIRSRSSVILSQFLGYSFAVYNGKDYIPVNISDQNMIGRKFGEFSPTRKFAGHSGDKKGDKKVIDMKNRDVIVEASSKVLKSTPRKLNLAAGLVRNKKVSFATVQLKFCEKKAAGLISKVLNSAIANAQYNYGLDIDNLYIKEILIGKSFTLRRVYPKAMGRANRISKRYSNITIKLGEVVQLVKNKKLEKEV